MTSIERASRQRARRMILDAANKARITRAFVRPFGARHLQQALNVCRRRALVKPGVLANAGFRTNRGAR